LVPGAGHNKYFKVGLPERICFLRQATNYFDFLTNDDDMKAKYLGGMNNFNFRQYSDGDESFA
jgi:hypothetical protein